MVGKSRSIYKYRSVYSNFRFSVFRFKVILLGKSSVEEKGGWMKQVKTKGIKRFGDWKMDT